MKAIEPYLTPDAETLKGKITNAEIAKVLAKAEINDPMVQFFLKMMSIAGITPNGDDENETNGYQLIDALTETIRIRLNKYLQPKTFFGSWDMENELYKSFAHGLTTAEFTNIASIECMITDNDRVTILSLTYNNSGYLYADANNVNMYIGTGKFQNTIYSGASKIDRYRVTIWFKEALI